MVRLLYLILLAAAALFYPLYEDKLSFITLATLVILPVILLCQLYISSMFLKCSMKKENITVYKGGEGEICIKLSNNSVFPLSGCKLKIKAVFRPTGEVRYYTAAVPLPALRTETASVNIEGVHCGAAEISLEYVKIYDLLRLFSLKKFKGMGAGGTVYIIPKANEKYFDEARRLLERPPAEAMNDSDMILNAGSGIPGDVNGFRDFAPGDRLSMIHYKLSARFDSDIVKEMPPGSSRRYLLTADTGSAKNAEERDELLERLMSCAYYLHENKAEVYTAVPSDYEYDKIALRSGEAAVYYDDTAYFPIARALCSEDLPAVPAESGFIYLKAETEKTEDRQTQ